MTMLLSSLEKVSDRLQAAVVAHAVAMPPPRAMRAPVPVARALLEEMKVLEMAVLDGMVLLLVQRPRAPPRASTAPVALFPMKMVASMEAVTPLR